MNDINCNEKLLNIFYLVIRKEFEDTKVVIRRRKLKDRQHCDQTTKGQATINKTLHRKLKIAHHKSH